MMSIKTVNALSHYTDWTIGHVHSGALGWVGYISFGAIYCLVPWLWNRPLYSLKLVNWHFWISTIGIVLYITAMWVSGILQGLMWRAYTSLGFLAAHGATAAVAMRLRKERDPAKIRALLTSYPKDQYGEVKLLIRPYDKIAPGSIVLTAWKDDLRLFLNGHL